MFWEGSRLVMVEFQVGSRNLYGFRVSLGWVPGGFWADSECVSSWVW